MSSEHLGSEGSAHQQLYEHRYEGNYMDTDDFSQWTKEGGTALKVYDTLAQIPSEPNAILDFGCGVGGWIGLLAGVYPNAKISGVDISSTAIDKATDRYRNCDFSTFDGSRTQYANKAFDLIFSFHVLEHVESIEDSIIEISRLLKDGGFACIIFPCGNKNSLQDMLMRRMNGGILPSDDGRTVHFFEIPDGHLRRMTSAETIKLFELNGLKLVEEFYSAQIFGWVDWLCRGTGPGYIRKMFSLEPRNLRAKIFLRSMEKILFALNWVVRKKNLDLTRKRNSLKQSVVFLAKYSAMGTDWLVKSLSELEWKLFRRRKNGSAQFLVFTKT